MIDPKDPLRPADPFGVGFLTDGTLDVVSPEAYEKLVLQRNAEEAEDDDEATA